MEIKSLDHVQLAMPEGSEEAARRFYGGLLGLVEVAKPVALAARGGCWFSGSGVHVHLGVDPEFVPARKAHPAFRVADLAAARAAFAAAGVAVREDTAVPHVRRCYVHDPFGNRLEFIQDGDEF